MIRRTLWGLACAALLIFPAHADERILDFHSDIQIRKDGALEVHETIRVRSEGDQIRHGIFRDFPTEYHGRTGLHYSVKFDVLYARMSGEPVPYVTEEKRNGVRVRIGSANTVLDPGEYTFELAYTATRELGFFDDHDELYWNVTGNGWRFPIDTASANVTLPPGADAAKVKVTGYTGPKGSKAKLFTSETAPDGTLRFATTAPLGVEEGLTIVVGFPKGLVTEPSSAERFDWFWNENGGEVFGVTGLAAVALYFFLAWMKVGRDPKRGTIVVLYDAPRNLSAAAIRYIRRKSCDNRTFACAVLGLAVKGYLSIKQAASVYTLTRLRPEDDKLPSEERNMMQALFAESGSLELKGESAGTIYGALSGLAEELKRSRKGAIRWNLKWSLVGTLLSLVVLLGTLAFASQKGDPGQVWGLAIFALLWSVAPITLIYFSSGTRRSRMPGEVSASSDKSFDRAMLLGGILFGVFQLGILVILGTVAGVIVALIVAALLALNICFYGWMKTITPEHRKLLDETEGFAQFLTAVEGDRLKYLNPEARTPEVFQKYLPYALAFDVEELWAQQFAGVLAGAAVVVGGAAAFSYWPAWYSDDTMGSFNAGDFTKSVTTSFSEAVSSSSYAPGSSSGFDSSSSWSSSSDSGGSSGGGGGGGGGGGW